MCILIVRKTWVCIVQADVCDTAYVDMVVWNHAYGWFGLMYHAMRLGVNLYYIYNISKPSSVLELNTRNSKHIVCDFQVFCSETKKNQVLILQNKQIGAKEILLYYVRKGKGRHMCSVHNGFDMHCIILYRSKLKSAALFLRLHSKISTKQAGLR